MVEIKELEKLCKDQYPITHKDASFDHVEERGNFLVASKAKEELVEKENVTPHKESSAIYFVVPYKDGKIGDETLLIDVHANEQFTLMAKDDRDIWESTEVEVKKKGERVAHLRESKYYDVADNEQLARFINNSDGHAETYMKTHNKQDYADRDKEYKLMQKDLNVNIERVSKVFTAFIDSDDNLEKEKLRIKRLQEDERKRKRSELRDKIKARVRKPLDEISGAIKNSRERRERSKKEKEITKSLSRTAGRDK